MKHKRIILSSILTCAPLIFNAPVEAQWTKCGPLGGSATSLALLGSRLFAGTAANPYYFSMGSGIYLSDDSGGSWRQSNTGLSDTNVLALAAEGTKLFASTQDSGIFRSIDSGATWTRLRSFQSWKPACRLATIGSMIFAATDSNGIFRTTDEGASWSAANVGLKESNIHSLAVVGSVLFANASYDGDGGVYKSIDSGQTWSKVCAAMFDIAAVGNTLFGCIYGGQQGVMYSLDSGATWHLGGGGPGGCGVYYSLASSGGVVFCFHTQDGGVAHSTDSGRTWTSDNVGCFSAIATLGSDLFLANTEGVHRTTDNGTTWVLSNNGMYPFATTPGGSITTLLTTASGLFAVSTTGGLLYSTDEGIDWRSRDNGLEGSTYVGQALAEHGTTLFASAQGLFRSSNDGASWAALSSNALPVDGLGSALPLNNFASIGTDLFASSNWGIFRSSDNGVTWEETDNSVEFSQSGDTYKIVTAIVALGTDLIAALDEGSIFRSTDLGLTWHPIRHGNADEETVTGLSVADSFLFLSLRNSAGQQVLRSSDEGTSWNNVPAGLTDFSMLMTVNSDVFAASTEGVIRSTDGGQNWETVNEGLPDLDLTSLAASNSYLFAGTYSGLWRRPISEIVKPAKIPPPPPPVITSNVAERADQIGGLTLRLFPNPATSTLTVNITLARRGHVRITLVDLLGTEIGSLDAGDLPAGERSLLWNLPSNIPNGRYECRVDIEGAVFQELVIVTR